MPLLILDRDGVINQDSEGYIRSLDDWLPIAGSIEAIAALSRAGFRIAIASNQSGLARGYFSLEQLEEIHSALRGAVEELGGHIAGIFYCPHHPDDHCDCRKPATGLLEAIERELGEPVAGAWFVGDSMKDLVAGTTAGCRPALVKTGKGQVTLEQLRGGAAPFPNPENIRVYEDLAAAARDILQS
jgi:D-glycero-D-manno-heptose 1,7-bisphosphate phosphatase